MINNTAQRLHKPGITKHILKAHDESNSLIIREHKYKDNEKDDDKDTLTEGLYMCYIC